MIRINEIFESIDGEVNWYGQGGRCTFIRFAGCNLHCLYCDTEYALKLSDGKEMTIDEIVSELNKYNNKRITITGGEPLLQKEGFKQLTKVLWYRGYQVSVETNGSIELDGYGVVSWVVDFKLRSSGQYYKMKEDVFHSLTANDYCKFVIEDKNDFILAVESMNQFIDKGCHAKFAFASITGKLEPKQLLKWMQEREVDGILNIQIHKYFGLK